MRAWIRGACCAVMALAGALVYEGAAAQPGVEAGAMTHGYIEVYGAVGKPGRILLQNPYLALGDVLTLAGGYTADAYLFGAVLLRAARHGIQTGRDCLPAAERQALEVLRAATADARSEEIATAILGHELYRVPLRLSPAELAGDAAGQVTLLDGDILIVPPRPAHVYTAGAVGRAGPILYEPGRLAEDYLDAAGGRDRWLSGSDWMVLPNGELRPLGLRFWNYRATAVPPGALLIFDADDSGICVGPTAR
ncbi:MAG: SLBB domain-containing protein [Pseudomonadota bacterium]